MADLYEHCRTCGYWEPFRDPPAKLDARHGNDSHHAEALVEDELRDAEAREAVLRTSLRETVDALDYLLPGAEEDLREARATVGEYSTRERAVSLRQIREALDRARRAAWGT